MSGIRMITGAIALVLMAGFYLGWWGHTAPATTNTPVVAITNNVTIHNYPDLTIAPDIIPAGQPSVVATPWTDPSASPGYVSTPWVNPSNTPISVETSYPVGVHGEEETVETTGVHGESGTALYPDSTRTPEIDQTPGTRNYVESLYTEAKLAGKEYNDAYIDPEWTWGKNIDQYRGLSMTLDQEYGMKPLTVDFFGKKLPGHMSYVLVPFVRFDDDHPAILGEFNLGWSTGRFVILSDKYRTHALRHLRNGRDGHGRGWYTTLIMSDKI